MIGGPACFHESIVMKIQMKENFQNYGLIKWNKQEKYGGE
jgi:hypothetical protein